LGSQKVLLPEEDGGKGCEGTEKIAKESEKRIGETP
jgi:hypothetical protein